MGMELARRGLLSVFRGMSGATVASCSQVAPARELSEVTGPRAPAAERV